MSTIVSRMSGSSSTARMRSPSMRAMAAVSDIPGYSSGPDEVGPPRATDYTVPGRPSSPEALVGGLATPRASDAPCPRALIRGGLPRQPSRLEAQIEADRLVGPEDQGWLIDQHEPRRAATYLEG